MPSAACAQTTAASSRRADPQRPALDRAPDIDDMEQRQSDEAVGDHAMIELHGQRVLEEIPPRRLVEQQARRHQRSVDQRPGVVDEPGMEARDQRAEIDLRNDEHGETGGGDGRCAAAPASAAPARHTRSAVTTSAA